jgi:hypothetical protein
MTASIARISRSYPRPVTVASNDGYGPEDPRIETKADKAVAAVVWVVIAPLLSVGVFAGLAKVLPVLIAYLFRN